MPAQRSLLLLFLFVLCLLLSTSSIHAQGAVQRNVSVSAKIPAEPEDFEIALDVENADTVFPPHSSILYYVIYGSTLNYATPLTIRVQWDSGGNPNGGKDVVQYLLGSASPAFGQTPVVDLTNRMITWNISSFPPETTDQQVDFRLFTSSDYEGTSSIPFTVYARLQNPDMTTPDVSKTLEYKYLAPGEQPTTPTPTPLPSVTPAEQAPVFANIDIPTISYDNAEITIELSDQGSVTLLYGMNPQNLSDSIASLTPSKTHRIKIPNLTEDTQYYFRIRARINGRIIESDLFTVRTGRNSPSPLVNNSTVVLVSDHIVVHNGADSLRNPVIPIPKNKQYHLTFSLSDRSLLEDIIVEVRNKSVLGINNFSTNERPVFATEVLEVKPGTFSTSLRAPNESAAYDVVARIFDTNGNISEIPLISLQVVSPLQIRDSASEESIENARVFLSIWNESEKSYERISEEYYALKNPSYSEPNGEVDIILPLGRYKAEVSAIGYRTQEIEFTVNSGQEPVYPTIELEKQPFSIVNAVTYYTTLTHDLLSRSIHYAKDIGESQRFFKLTAYGAVALFVFLSFLALSQKISVPIHLLPRYILHRIKAFRHSEDSTRKEGIIIDSQSHTPLSDVHVALLDLGSGKVIAETSTSHAGRFVFKRVPDDLHAVVILTKNNFYPSRFSLPLYQEDGPCFFALTQSKKDHVISELFASFQNMIGMLFNALVTLSFLTSILLGIFFGFGQSVPFMALTSLNLLLWLFYSHTKKLSSS